ncbi:hypothetical protein ACFOSV_03900 [Algoriphagus namhaensis]|uniref:Uncharacterized protein n=1 Tax=Algoriphagus namhaensis TaxID=915353 RepID=A0ABV8AMP3_9BACT
MTKFSFFLSVFLLWSFGVIGQSGPQSDTFLRLYKEQLPYFQELISGGEYSDPPKSINGEPYFKSRNFDYGSLRINKIDYQEVPLLYDTHRDVVVTFHPIHNQKILIKSEKVDEFVIFESDVIRNFKGNEGYPHHGNGFYRVVKDSEVKVLVKYYKDLKVSKDMTSYLKEFVEYSDHFLWFQGDFVKINSKKDAIKALGLDKKQVRKELPIANYQFKANISGYLQQLVDLRVQSSNVFNGFAQ